MVRAPSDFSLIVLEIIDEATLIKASGQIKSGEATVSLLVHVAICLQQHLGRKESRLQMHELLKISQRPQRMNLLMKFVDGLNIASPRVLP